MLGTSLSFPRLPTSSSITPQVPGCCALPYPLASAVLIPTLGEMVLAGTQARVPEVPQIVPDGMDAHHVIDQAVGLLPPGSHSPHDTTRHRPAAHPHTETVEPPKESTVAWEVCPKGEKRPPFLFSFPNQQEASVGNGTVQLALVPSASRKP